MDDDFSLDIATRIERRRRALKVKDFAELIGLSEKQVYALVQEGQIPFYRIGGAIRLDPAKLARWLRAQSA